jgi:ABC-type multidrug transport system ATPase subunit
MRIGYLSAGSGTYPDLSVDENLAFRASAYQMPAAAARERSSEFVERAGLAGARDRLAGQLSGGMRQTSASSPRCCTSPTCWCWTSPPPAWTRSAGPTCGG